MDYQVIWAAGLFEGEGSISALDINGVQVALGMTDLDVVRTFHRIVGVGAIYEERTDNPKHNTCYRWKISSKADVQHVLLLLEPFLHDRRKEKVAWAMERLANNRGMRPRRPTGSISA